MKASNREGGERPRLDKGNANNRMKYGSNEMDSNLLCRKGTAYADLHKRTQSAGVTEQVKQSLWSTRIGDVLCHATF